MNEEAYTLTGISKTSHPVMAPATKDLNNNASDGNTKGKKMLVHVRSCMPLTIALIKNHVQPVEERFMLKDKELTDICIIGVIRAITVQQASVSYTIEDGTGAIDVKQWNDPMGTASYNETEESVNANTAEVYPSGIYIKVLGRIQSYSDRMFCVSLKTEPINDLNEVSFHYLSAIQAYLELTVIKPSLSSSNIQFPRPLLHKISKNNINGIVKRAIKLCGDDEVGSHISTIMSHLKNMFDETQILKSLSELADEGQIYSLTEEYVQLVDF
ncbi:DNA-directed RNA polymerase I subunit rpa2 [Mucor circinelloides]